jgi:hypothetical protein
VESGVTRHLGMERCSQQVALLDRYHAPVRKRCKGDDALPHLLDHRRTDKDRMHRGLADGWDVEIGLKGVQLRPERISSHGDVETTDALLVGDGVENPVGKQDQPGAGAIGRKAAADRTLQRLRETEDAGQLIHDARFTARDNETAHLGELFRTANRASIRSQRLENRDVLAEITLERKDTDYRGRATSHVLQGGAVRANRTR